MFDFLFPTEPFGGQTLRLVAQAQQGGGDLFDIARTCRDIKPGDKQSWEKGWLELAQKTEARATEALGAGRKITARDYFFHANQYYRMSDVFLTYQENDRKAERFRKAQECFRAGAGLNKPAIEVISVQCGEDEYDGYFCHPTNPAAGKWPAIFFSAAPMLTPRRSTSLPS